MKDFLKSAEEQLKNSKDKSSVMAELGDHLETKKEYFEFIGYDEAASAEKANEAMGDGEVIGQRLNYIHRPKKELEIALIAKSVIINLLLLGVYAYNNSSYLLPFLIAAFFLINYFLDTVFAIKFKSIALSALLMSFSVTTMRIYIPRLAYPICNLIINQSTSESADDIYEFSYIAITLLICVLIFLPNIFNIHLSRQIKQLKNTKKQNKIATALVSCFLIFSVLTGAFVYPYYMFNDRICKDQVQIRDELIDFAVDIESKFDGKQHKELAEYLENSEYDFDLYTSYNYDNGIAIPHYTYTYYKGNWWVRITFDDGSDNYIVYLENRIMNISQKYLFTEFEETYNLADKLGGGKYEYLTGDTTGKSAKEIRDIMNDVNIMSLRISKTGDSSVCNYKWAERTVLYGSFGYNHYTFNFDKDGICYKYDLTLD